VYFHAHRQPQRSDATIVRTAQALGYAGFADLRRELIDAVRNQVSELSRLRVGV
jgi:DNA-binding MurR/RpiR family transcriptional regulator